MFDTYEDLLTIEELCALLSIGKNTAYTLLKKSQIKSFKVGKSWKIPKQAVEDYILAQSGLSTNFAKEKIITKKGRTCDGMNHTCP